MKAKKWLTFIVAGISALSLICAIIANCYCVTLMYDISMAIFGSALLGFIMSLIEYFVERRKSMEYFFTSAYKAYVRFRDIKWIEMIQQRELILDCISEEQRNKMWKNCDEETAKILSVNTVHKKRDEYIAWMQENEPMYFSIDDDVESILIEVYNKRIEYYSKMFISYMDIYIKVSKISFEDLSNSYANLDFLFGNRKVRKTAFESIYSKLQEYHNKISTGVIHFNRIKDGKGNFAVCCKKVLELNEFFFETETVQSGDKEITKIYQRKFDELSDRLEEFRSKIYFNKEVQYEKKSPVFSQVKKANGLIEEESAF